MTATTEKESGPTGLDYQAAYAAMYPGLVAEGIALSKVQDSVLRVVDRAARLRKAERERVKTGVQDAIDQMEAEAVMPVSNYYANRLRKAIEEIR